MSAARHGEARSGQAMAGPGAAGEQQREAAPFLRNEATNHKEYP